MKKSTKTKDRKLALAMAVEFEKAAMAGVRGNLTETQTRKVLSEILETATGKPLQCPTLAEFLSDWLKDKVTANTEKTALKYKQVTESFIASLGKRAELSVGAITPSDIRNWRDSLQRQGRSASTVNGSAKVISAAFEQARKLAYIPANPCNAVTSLRAGLDGARETFSREQIRLLLSVAKATDWEGAILVGYFTGLRLKDIANLEWASVDLGGGFIRVKTSKTGKAVAVPLHQDVRTWLEGQTQGVGKEPVFSKLKGTYTGGKSGLSGQFKKLMGKAGIQGQRLRAGGGAGRATSSLSFHSLRHSFISELANAGVSSELRKELAGHSSDAAHKVYTHHEAIRLKQAVDAIGGLSCDSSE